MEDRNSQMIYWFERAVENGEEWAAVTLGRKYENGYTPVQVDVAKAKMCIRDSFYREQILKT